MKHTSGSIEVITGSMFCGKTNELIRRLRRATIARQKVQVFKPAIDNRYALEKVTSQQLRYIEANGSAPASLFTGNAADTTIIYWIMRDIGAAHRIISADEAGFTGNALGYYYTNSAWVLDPVGRTSWPLILNMITNYYGPCMTFLPPNQAANVNPANILSFQRQLSVPGHLFHGHE